MWTLLRGAAIVLRRGKAEDVRGHEILTSMLAGSILKIMATVQLTVEAREQARRLPKPIRKLLDKRLEGLRKWPSVSGVKPLKANLSGWYRLRISDYRIRFRVEGDIVIVDKMGHRKDIYED